MKRNSELAFKDIYTSSFGAFIKIVYNGNIIFDDTGELLIIENHEIKNDNISIAIKNFIKKYESKHIYNFYCRVVDFHHTELYIEGE